MAEVDVNKKELVDKKINESDISVYAYDKALVLDLRQRFSKDKVNDKVQITNPDNTFNVLGTLDNDKVILPFISLQRNNWTLQDEQPYQKFEGSLEHIEVDKSNINRQVRLQALPIMINYTLSVWTKDRVTNDAILRELIFYYKIRPTLEVYIPHGINTKRNFNVRFEDDITDNSDIASYSERMNYVRQDVNIYIDDAYLWKSNYRSCVKIDSDINFYYDFNVDQ